jgi:hypothetical protein
MRFFGVKSKLKVWACGFSEEVWRRAERVLGRAAVYSLMERRPSGVTSSGVSLGEKLAKGSIKSLWWIGVMEKVREWGTGLLVLIAKRIRILEPSMVAGVGGLVLDQSGRRRGFCMWWGGTLV